MALVALGSSQPKSDALLCCAPWNRQVVSDRLVSGFHQEVVNRGYVSGTLFSPGGFTRDAYEFQGKRPIELVSGEDFVEVIGRLPEGERDYLLRLTTAGDFDIPTCPACGVKLELRDSAMPEGVGRLKNLTVRRSETFAGDVRCNKLHIAKGAEAQFTKGVYANKMTFHGRAIGSFTCTGTAEILPGASVIGMVAARSIDLRPGGVLDGEMKILDEAEIKPVRPIPKDFMWGCPNYPKCDVVLPTRGVDASEQSGERSAA